MVTATIARAKRKMDPDEFNEVERLVDRYRALEARIEKPAE